mmetsp:Transcript_8816/g.16830  ORF Transcript_8816/g.16830 Transcript_8816/m.16830 type:complete len:87 (+) Transcript_8816:418-678(+)
MFAVVLLVIDGTINDGLGTSQRLGVEECLLTLSQTVLELVLFVTQPNHQSMHASWSSRSLASARNLLSIVNKNVIPAERNSKVNSR